MARESRGIWVVVGKNDSGAYPIGAGTYGRAAFLTRESAQNWIQLSSIHHGKPVKYIPAPAKKGGKRGK